MPIYEYRCRDCGAKSTFITLSVSARIELKCSRCGKPNLTKLVSRVAVLRSEGKMGRGTSEDMGEDFGQGLDEGADDGDFGGGEMSGEGDEGDE